MSRVQSFSAAQIDGIAKLLGDAGTGSDIDRVLVQCRLVDESGISTKWRRLNELFLQLQKRHGCANNILGFIQSFLHPARFVGRLSEFEAIRDELNVLLAFSGLEFGRDGRFARARVSQTLDDAERRVRTIRLKFQGRRMHTEVLKYCRSELLQDNYFHAVFEATKGLAQRIREMSGVDEDGARLIDRVFSIERPLLAMNTLRTETEKSEHRGLAALLRGCFGAIRNPLAHGPKILWDGEDDAADYLSLISLLHRKLDDCVPTNQRST